MDTAISLVEQASQRFEQLGLRRGIADSMWLRAIVARIQGDNATARTRAEESLRMHRELGDRFGTTDALHVLGRIALADGDLETAKACYMEALEYDVIVENRTGVGIVLDNLATQASLHGEYLRSLRLGGASEAIKESAGGHAPPPFIDLTDPREVAAEALGAEAVNAAWEEGRAMTFDQAVAYAREELDRDRNA